MTGKIPGVPGDGERFDRPVQIAGTLYLPSAVYRTSGGCAGTVAPSQPTRTMAAVPDKVKAISYLNNRRV